MEFRYAQEINCMPRQVFRCLTEEDLLRQWYPALERMRFTGEFNPKNAIGSRFVLAVREGKTVREYAGLITDYQLDRSFGIVLDGPMLHVKVNFQIHPLQHGCDLRYSSHTSFHRLQDKLVSKLFAILSRKLLKKQMQQLKILAESMTD